jgi:hypothetical protein
MADGEEFGSGVVSVFEAIASGEEGTKAKKRTPTKLPSERRDPAVVLESRKPAPKPSGSTSRPRARLGRFPGRRNGRLKEKITGRITPELKDAYVDWALTDRVALGDLLEKALIEYYHRHRALDKREETTA